MWIKFDAIRTSQFVVPPAAAKIASFAADGADMGNTHVLTRGRRADAVR